MELEARKQLTSKSLKKSNMNNKELSKQVSKLKKALSMTKNALAEKEKTFSAINNESVNKEESFEARIELEKRQLIESHERLQINATSTLAMSRAVRGEDLEETDGDRRGAEGRQLFRTAMKMGPNRSGAER